MLQKFLNNQTVEKGLHRSEISKIIDQNRAIYFGKRSLDIDT